LDISLHSKVAFYNQNQLLIGTIEAENNGVFTVKTLAGLSFELRASRFVLAENSPLELADFILQAQQSSASYSEAQFTFLSQSAFSLDGIATQLGISVPAELFGLYLYLKNHPELYHEKKELFRKLSSQEQDLYQQKQDTEKARAGFLHNIREFIAGQPLDPETQALLYRELTAANQESPNKDLMRLIHSAYPELDHETALMKFRVFCGELPSETDPALAKSGLPVGFPLQLTQHKLIQTSPLTEVQEVFCIDAEDSKDFDDALSLERTAEGWRLGIHVSCVALAIESGSPLFGEAAQRISSIYLANMVVPMFPTVFSEGALSLLGGAQRPTLSLYLNLDSDYRILSRELKQDTVHTQANLSYNEVDRNLDKEPFKTLLAISSKLCSERDGISDSNKPRFYSQIKLVNAELQVLRIDTESPARKMVEELMILYNSSLALQARNLEIPVLYRNVQQFAASPNGFPATQAYLSTYPEFHPGIGTAAYLHASSPVRRYVDLINQHQILAQLGGKPLPFSTEQLNAEIEKVEKRLNLIRETVHLSDRWWWLKFLEQNWLNTPLDAYIVQVQQDRVKMELPDWGIQVWANCGVYPRYEQVKVVFYGVNWEDRLLKAELL
jgi:exoribonuclease-2